MPGILIAVEPLLAGREVVLNREHRGSWSDWASCEGATGPMAGLLLRVHQIQNEPVDLLLFVFLSCVCVAIKSNENVVNTRQ